MIKTMWKTVMLGAAVGLTSMFAGPAAQAQTYPAKPITVIMPFAGGSASDVIARILLNRMAAAIGQPFVVDNRPGAGGNTGTAQAASATPDGYTLVVSSSGPLAANRALVRNLGYDPEKDFEPVSLFAVMPNVIVINAKLPVKNIAEFIAYAKARPKELNYGTVGVGSSQHLSAAYFEQIAGIQLSHVPYRNIAQYTPDFIAGQVPLGFQLLPNVLAMIQSGDARPLAVTTNKRMTALPDVPTVAEAGIQNYESSAWFALLAPRGTPKPIVAKLNEALATAIADPAVRTRFTEQGAEPVNGTPEELGKFIASETVKWRDIISKAGIPLIQ
jgi:tripartite-type tricarboxylate transporter receptor subunit TctC